VVRTANADPVYDVIVAADIPSISRSKISDFWGTPFWGNIPDKPSTFPPSTHASTHASGGSDPVSLDASQITSGRLSLSRLPTSATANRFLVVRTANADPTYDAIAAADVPGLDASKIVSGRFSVSRLPDGTSGYVLVGQGSGYDMAWKDISGIAGTITDSQHGTKTGIPFAHHGDWGHYGEIPRSAPTGAADRCYVDGANLYVHDGSSWVLQATKDWNNLINKPSTFPPSPHATTHQYGGTDLVTNLDYLAIRGTTVITIARILQNIASVAQTLLPFADNTYALGSSSYRWSDVRTVLLNGWNPDAHASRHASGGADAVSLDASQITSGRLSLSRLPTSATANRVLLVRTANADPTYDQVDWNTDIKNIPSTFPPSAHASTHEYGGTDLVRNLDYLAIRGTTVINSSRNLVGINVVAQNLVPDIDITRNLGSSSYHFYTLYCGYMQRANGPIGILPYSELNLGGGNSYRWQINTSGHLIPFSDNSYDIGTSSIRVRNLYVAGTANVGSVLPVGGAGSGYVGNSTYYWYAVYSFWAYFANAYPKDGDNTGALGSTETRWAVLYAVTKSAAFKHPLHNPKRYIVFKCVESPKVTVEDWGIAELKNGKAFVGFSEEFVALMSDKAEYAVFLTPEGECNGLYVSKKEFYGFEVKELGNGKSNIRFSWHVKAIRIGDEETPVLEEPAPTEPEKREEWTAKRRESAQKKEEDRLNRMKQKIAKYREATSQT
jgi:hypothetical protein